jgi:hypothetical protein
MSRHPVPSIHVSLKTSTKQPIMDYDDLILDTATAIKTPKVYS